MHIKSLKKYNISARKVIKPKGSDRLKYLQTKNK